MTRVLLSLCSILLSNVALAQPAEPTEPAATPPPDGSDASAAGDASASTPTASVDTTKVAASTTSRYAGADAPPPGAWRLIVSDLTLFRLNPLGLESRARAGLQKRLFASEKAVTKNNFGFIGIYPKLNPAAALLGVGGELQPASVFNLRAFAEVQQYFGTFGYLQTFQSVNTNFSDQTLKDLRDSTTTPPQAKRILHASIQPQLQAKVGPIAVRALLQLDYWALSGTRAGDTSVYDATFDTLLPDGGWTLSTDVDVLYVGKPGLAVGLRHSHVHPFYKRKHFADQADFDAYDGDNMHSRIGLFGAFTLKDLGPSTFNKPTVILILSWYHQHRYRLGEPDMLPTGGRAEDYTSRAFPYVLAAFAFESDFWDVR